LKALSLHPSQETPPVQQTLGELADATDAGFFPLNAQLYVINACHLKCKHCYESQDTHPTSAMLSLAEIEKILDELASMGTLRLTLTGGEIFLRKDILQIIKAAKARRFHLTLFTSGTHIDQAMAGEIAALKVDEVDISLYSDRAEDHDAFTQEDGSWKKSTDAMRALRALSVNATLKCVLSTFSVDRIDAIMALAKSLDVGFQFDPSIRPRLNNDDGHMDFSLSADELRRKVYSRRDLAPSFRRYQPEQVCQGEVSLNDPNAAMCGAAREVVAIGAGGEIYPCGFFPIPVGRVQNEGLKAVWERNTVMQDMRRMTRAKMHTCPTCENNKVCGPCMAYAQVETGSYKGCNSGSRTTADAFRLFSGDAARANKKNKPRKNGLPIVGDTHLPDPPDGSAKSALAMFD
jgi:radical SAM protein with 4Fe4S-binding SPASM domain